MRSSHRLSTHSPRLLPATLLVMAGLVVTAAGVAPATAADDGLDTTVWGTQGIVRSTDSAVTVRWDDQYGAGQTPPPAEDRVARDASQTLAHSGGQKNYDDLAPGIREQYANYFGSADGVVGDDGRQGLQLTVSQTKDLVNQTVNIRVSGAVASGNSDLGGSATVMQIMQCWGAASESAPDPAHCETGVLPADGGTPTFGSIDSNDVALIGADDPIVRTGIDGSDESAFNAATTNELGARPVNADGSIDESFQVLTGAESNYLGCGTNTDPSVPSTDTCWLVIVPYNAAAAANSGAFANASALSPITPSLWAQRMQVRLSMAPLPNGCPNGQARTLSEGSEQLRDAMASWIPAVCDVKSVALGYTPRADFSARQDLQAGSTNFILTTQPVEDTPGVVYVPVALNSLTIAFTIDSDHQTVRRLKLTPRLVAKLLTESYQMGSDWLSGNDLARKAPWTSRLPVGLANDPEFQKLNPGIRNNVGSAVSGGDLVVSNTDSDAVEQLWTWLLADDGADGAKAFLDGCPDDDGMTINPFFSSRSYVECPLQKNELDVAAQAEIDATETPDNYTYVTPSYPPDSAVFPQPGWYARDAISNQSALTLPDIHSHTNILADTGADVARAVYPANTQWCDGSQTATCKQGDEPGMWKSSGVPQSANNRGVLGITDSSTAGRYQTTTALLCDDSGAHCVGPDTASLQKAATSFVKTSTPGVLRATGEGDYASGIYPLTLPVYAAVQTDGLSKDDAKTIATALGYITTDGQKPGVNQGQLPPGYAPLTSTLLTQARAGLATLTAPPTKPGGDDQPRDGDDQPGDGGGAQPGDNGGNPPGDGGQQSVGDGQNDDGQDNGGGSTVPTTTTVPTDDGGGTKTTDGGGKQTPPPTLPPDAVAAAVKTPKTASGFPQYGLAGGLIGALLAVGIAPVVGASRRRRG